MSQPHFTDKEAIEMMERCKLEIRDLRAQVERLRPKAEAYDNIAQILRYLPQPSQGFGEDMVWKLDQRINQIKEAARAAAKDAEANAP